MKRFALCLLLLFTITAFAAAQDQAKAVSPSELKLDVFPNFPTCVKGAVLYGDPGSDNGATIYVKGTPGCVVPWHFHTPIEEVGVVTGSLKIEMKDGAPKTLGPGGYAVFPAKHVHQATCASACTFFVGTHGKFDIHYVDSSGNEIPFEQAVKSKPAAGKGAAAKKGAAKKE
jgi:quercetin dioxygenase-like cupin family protein